jgi:hypothetical protein
MSQPTALQISALAAALPVYGPATPPNDVGADRPAAAPTQVSQVEPAATVEDRPPVPAVHQPLKLLVERDPATGVFVQRFINEATGELELQWPRQAWLDMVQRFDAATGRLMAKEV